MLSAQWRYMFLSIYWNYVWHSSNWNGLYIDHGDLSIPVFPNNVCPWPL
jgi:hypothetical protein